MIDSAPPVSPVPKSPLAIADYRLLLISRFFSVVATTGMVVILGYQLYDLARSDYGMSIAQAAFQLGLLGLAQFLPLFLLTPVAGLVADRFDRRKVAGLAICLDMAVALVLAVVTQSGLLTLPLLFSLAALHGTARVFIGPALSSIAPNIVPAEIMPKAIAFNSMAWQIGSVGGPAIAGLLFAGNASLPYWTSTLLLGLAASCVFAIRKLPAPAGNRNVHPIRQIREGLAFVWNDRFLLGCITLDLFAVLVGGATALLPVFARDILMIDGHPVGPGGLGIMRAMPGVGAALVAFILSMRPIASNVGNKMLLSVAVFGALTIGFGLSGNYYLSLLLLAGIGASDMVSVFIRTSLVQLHTPDDVRGRVSSISGLAISASNELGEMQSGVAAALVGAVGAVIIGGVGAIAVTALWFVFFPELKNARTFAAQYRTS